MVGKAGDEEGVALKGLVFPYLMCYLLKERLLFFISFYVLPPPPLSSFITQRCVNTEPISCDEFTVSLMES